MAVDGGAPAETVIDMRFSADDDPGLLNPERGIYYWSPSASDPHTLVAEWLYLGDACDDELRWAGRGAPTTSQVLDDYAEALVAHRAAGRKVVFRPRYDTPSSEGAPNGCGLFEADGATRMRGHVDAVAAMLAEHADVVAFIEAGYLGRWGEWNHADHAASTSPVLVDPAARRAFLAYVVEAYASAGLRRFVEVRRPLFAKELVDADASAAVGLYNDCFMTTSSDYGTYSNFESGNPSNFANAADAKAWAVAWTAGAPFGGETCPTGDGTERWRSCDAMVGPSSEPGSLHMSYLHGGYAVDARSTWETSGCYEEIRRRLGYRFEVDAVEYPPEAAPGQPLTVSVSLRNTGWARMHNPRRAALVLRSASAAYVVGDALDGYESIAATPGGDAVESWAPGETTTFTASFAAPPAGTYSLRLMLPDPDRPEVIAYAVKLASRRDGVPVFDATTGENDLGVTLTVPP